MWPTFLLYLGMTKQCSFIHKTWLMTNLFNCCLCKKITKVCNQTWRHMRGLRFSTLLIRLKQKYIWYIYLILEAWIKVTLSHPAAGQKSPLDFHAVRLCANGLNIELQHNRLNFMLNLSTVESSISEMHKSIFYLKSKDGSISTSHLFTRS